MCAGAGAAAYVMKCVYECVLRKGGKVAGGD